MSTAYGVPLTLPLAVTVQQVTGADGLDPDRQAPRRPPPLPSTTANR